MQLRERERVCVRVRERERESYFSCKAFLTGGQIETQPFKKMLLLFMVRHAKANQVLSAYGYIYFESHTIELAKHLFTLYQSCYLFKQLLWMFQAIKNEKIIEIFVSIEV